MADDVVAPAPQTFVTDPPAGEPAKVAPPVDDKGTEPPTPSPAPDALKGKWQAHLSPELQAEPELLKHEKLDHAAKAYLDAAKANAELTKKMESAIFVPGEGASKEEVEAFFARLGRPKTAEEYDFDFPAELPKWASTNEAERVEGLKEMKEFMHSIGLTKKVAEQVFQRWIEAKNADVAAAEEYIQSVQDETRTKLRREPGWTTEPEFKANAEHAATAVTKFGGQEAWDYFYLMGYQFDPMLIKIFAKVGQALASDTPPPPGGGVGPKETPRDESGNPMLFGPQAKK